MVPKRLVASSCDVVMTCHFCYPKQKNAFFFSEKHTVWLLIFSTSHAPNLHAKNFKHGFLVEIKRSELRMESVFLCSTCKVPFKEKLCY